MTRDARFWRNVTIVGLIHVAVLLGLLWWSRSPEPPPERRCLDGRGRWSASNSAAQAPTPAPPTTPLETPPPAEETPTPEIAPTAKSEIEIPSPTPSATPTPTPNAHSDARANGNSQADPASDSKTHAQTDTETLSNAEKEKAQAEVRRLTKRRKRLTKETGEKKRSRKPPWPKEKSGAGEEDSPKKSVRKATAAEGEESGNAKGSEGSGGKGSGAGGASEFGWYGNMLHDRFFGEWVQPTTVVHSAKLIVTLRIRIQKDGRISDFSIAKSSGNPVVDDSVTAAAARVKQVDPLPSGLGDDYYDVNINFELN